MRTGSGLLIGLLALIGLGAAIAYTCLFTVPEWEQALITQFGEIKGEPITEAGLYFKLPWQVVERFDKRLLRWDGSQTTTITRDRRTINVDVTARWRISDARRFLETTRSINQADVRLNGIIEGAVKDEIAKFELYEVVRSSNRILDLDEEGLMLEVRDEDGMVISSEDFATLGVILPRLNQDASGRYTAGRPIVLEGILNEARRRIEQVGLGIHLEDVLIKQLGYIREIESNVYAQMNAELNKIAAGFRSIGQQRAEQRLGEMTRELAIIESAAIERSQRVRGQAEAESIKIYADAFNRDPEFYQLIRSLDAYDKVLGPNTSIIMGTDSALYRLLKQDALKPRP
jgi:modulator of FtsH protease HflC